MRSEIHPPPTQCMPCGANNLLAATVYKNLVYLQANVFTRKPRFLVPSHCIHACLHAGSPIRTRMHALPLIHGCCHKSKTWVEHVRKTILQTRTDLTRSGELPGMYCTLPRMDERTLNAISGLIGISDAVGRPTNRQQVDQQTVMVEAGP